MHARGFMRVTYSWSLWIYRTRNSAYPLNPNISSNANLDFWCYIFQQGLYQAANAPLISTDPLLQQVCLLLLQLLHLTQPVGNGMTNRPRASWGVEEILTQVSNLLKVARQWMLQTFQLLEEIWIGCHAKTSETLIANSYTLDPFSTSF